MEITSPHETLKKLKSKSKTFFIFMHENLKFGGQLELQHRTRLETETRNRLFDTRVHTEDTDKIYPHVLQNMLW